MHSQFAAPCSRTRRRLDPAGAREAILAAAAALLVETGPDGLRLTEIAARAGVSHPNILYHFGSVAQLQAQLAQRVAERLAAEIARLFEGDAGIGQPVDLAVRSVFRVFDEGGYAKLFAWLALSKNEPSFAALARQLTELATAVQAHPRLAGDDQRGRRRRVATAIELVTVAALGYGLSKQMLSDVFPDDRERPSVPVMLAELLNGEALERR